VAKSGFSVPSPRLLLRFRSGWRASALLLAFAIAALQLSASAAKRPSGNKTTAEKIFEPPYVAALAAANRFLYSLQTHDQESALLLLTTAAKKSCSEDRLAMMFSPDSTISYEIARGRRVKPGRYIFPVALFEVGSHRRWARPRYSQITVVRTADDDWAVETLP
jgi:hypothetical protein